MVFKAWLINKLKSGAAEEEQIYQPETFRAL